MFSAVRPCQVVCHSTALGDWTDGVGFPVTADFVCTIDNRQFLDFVSGALALQDPGMADLKFNIGNRFPWRQVNRNTPGWHWWCSKKMIPAQCLPQLLRETQLSLKQIRFWLGEFETACSTLQVSWETRGMRHATACAVNLLLWGNGQVVLPIAVGVFLV